MAKKKKVKVSRGKDVLITAGNVKKGSGNNMLSVKKPGNLGTFGCLTFVVNQNNPNKRKVLTPRDIQRELGARWSIHEVIGGVKPRTEYIGPDIDTLELKITVDVMFGHKPHYVMRKLNDFLRDGKVDYFYLGSHKLGTGKWKIEKLSESYDLVYAHGELARATLDITLSEYF